jgi:hypothetical protein
MANLYSQFTFDKELQLRADGAAITATETNATILDLGTGLIDGYAVFDVTALDVTTGDESYKFMVQMSPDATFGTAGNIRVVAQLHIGGATATAPNGAADTVGRFVLPFRNEKNGVTYRYMRLYTLIAGTTPSIDFSAFLAKDE